MSPPPLVGSDVRVQSPHQQDQLHARQFIILIISRFNRGDRLPVRDEDGDGYVTPAPDTCTAVMLVVIEVATATGSHAVVHIPSVDAVHLCAFSTTPSIHNRSLVSHPRFGDDCFVRVEDCDLVSRPGDAEQEANVLRIGQENTAKAHAEVERLFYLEVEARKQREAKEAQRLQGQSTDAQQPPRVSRTASGSRVRPPLHPAPPVGGRTTATASGPPPKKANLKSGRRDASGFSFSDGSDGSDSDSSLPVPRPRAGDPEPHLGSCKRVRRDGTDEAGSGAL